MFRPNRRNIPTFGMKTALTVEGCFYCTWNNFTYTIEELNAFACLSFLIRSHDLQQFGRFQVSFVVLILGKLLDNVYLVTICIKMIFHIMKNILNCHLS